MIKVHTGNVKFYVQGLSARPFYHPSEFLSGPTAMPDNPCIIIMSMDTYGDDDRNMKSLAERVFNTADLHTYTQ